MPRGGAALLSEPADEEPDGSSDGVILTISRQRCLRMRCVAVAPAPSSAMPPHVIHIHGIGETTLPAKLKALLSRSGSCSAARNSTRPWNGPVSPKEASRVKVTSERARIVHGGSSHSAPLLSRSTLLPETLTCTRVASLGPSLWTVKIIGTWSSGWTRSFKPSMRTTEISALRLRVGVGVGVDVGVGETIRPSWETMLLSRFESSAAATVSRLLNTPADPSVAVMITEASSAAAMLGIVHGNAAQSPVTLSACMFFHAAWTVTFVAGCGPALWIVMR